MVGIAIAIGFIGMVLAPCALALYSKLGGASEAQENGPEAATASAAPIVPAATEVMLQSEGYLRRPVPLSTSAKRVLAPVAVPTLREIAKQAANEAIAAQARVTSAKIEALQEASRAAAQRAAAAEKLAEAAERELVRASQASLQAEVAQARAKMAQQSDLERDYLPQNHPSLDFPRSRVPSRRVA